MTTTSNHIPRVTRTPAHAPDCSILDFEGAAAGTELRCNCTPAQREMARLEREIQANKAESELLEYELSTINSLNASAGRFADPRDLDDESRASDFPAPAVRAIETINEAHASQARRNLRRLRNWQFAALCLALAQVMTAVGAWLAVNSVR